MSSRLSVIFYIILCFEIGIVLRFDRAKVLDERIANNIRQRNVPILISFASTDHDFILRKIDVFDTQSAAFDEAQTGAIEQ